MTMAYLNDRRTGGDIWMIKDEQNRATDRTMEAPLRVKKPTMYFVNSMSDWLHTGGQG
jgi:protein gp37